MEQMAMIDWLAFTVSWDKIIERLGRSADQHPANVIAKTIVQEALTFRKPSTPVNGYAYAIENEAGARVNFSKFGSNMGVHFIFSGSVMAQMDWRYLLGVVEEWDAHVSRIDLALDVKESKLDIRCLRDAMRSGQVETKARKWSFLEGSTGDTLYIGSRSSERMLRIYDKAAEMGTPWMNWKRIELECKGDAGHWIAKSLLKLSSEDFVGIILSVANFSHDEGWNSIFANDTPITWERSDAKSKDTLGWLTKYVVPSIARLMMDDPEAYDAYEDALIGAIEAEHQKRQGVDI